VALAQGAGYVGAGTVEFLVEGDSFYLMEMNTRLQVEHPVTEAITGLDLVEWQLRVAQGEPLPLTQTQVQFKGHSIEVRLCAEDENYIPHTGTVLHFSPPQTGLRFDHAIREGSSVSPYYDAMLGKLIAHADTREAAIGQLVLGLSQLQVLGLPTNRAFLVACLDHPQFRAGQALIPFLVERGDAIRQTLQQQEQQVLMQCAKMAIFHPHTAAQALPAPFARAVRLQYRGALMDLRVQELGEGRVQINGSEPPSMPGSACCALGDGRWQVQCGGVDLWLEDATYAPTVHAGSQSGPREIRAPFNGKLVRMADVGQTVARGDTLAVIESMKIEHAIPAPAAGTVSAVRVTAGVQVLPNQVLLNLEPV
jgi:3-methylcrotonyl-CoA carboxylase alpha subunit/geranyl-CoA carboxylase alpha subunit